MKSDQEFQAFQSFTLGCKLFWTSAMFSDLQDLYEHKRDLAGPAAGEPGPERVAGLLADEPTYRYFAWMERHLQRFKYSGRGGLVPYHQARRDALETALAAPLPEGMLELDPAFEQPKYYRSVDIHQHPGGVWSDSLAGYVYQRGARSTTPLLSRDRDLHHRFTDLVLQRRRPAKLVDLGCGFGKSTQPFADAVKEADVTAVDLAAPCLTLAAQNAAAAQARNLRFLQRDARRTGLPEAGYDVVTSTMLLHELPPPEIEAVIRESHRLLEPGGLMIHLDFLPPDDEFLTFLHYGHGRRNNEPFMEPLAKMNIAERIERAGFRDVTVEPFAEMEGALEIEGKWRFPWVVISGVKA
jgi:ubiquinone/menaquinone biosynthesis C-methylase UbiE